MAAANPNFNLSNNILRLFFLICILFFEKQLKKPCKDRPNVPNLIILVRTFGPSRVYKPAQGEDV